MSVASERLQEDLTRHIDAEKAESAAFWAEDARKREARIAEERARWDKALKALPRAIDQAVQGLVAADFPSGPVSLHDELYLEHEQAGILRPMSTSIGHLREFVIASYVEKPVGLLRRRTKTVLKLEQRRLPCWQVSRIKHNGNRTNGYGEGKATTYFRLLLIPEISTIAIIREQDKHEEVRWHGYRWPVIINPDWLVLDSQWSTGGESAARYYSTPRFDYIWMRPEELEGIIRDLKGFKPARLKIKAQKA